MPSTPHPSVTDTRLASQSVSEPVVLMAMSLPLRSATLLIGESAPTTTEMSRGSLPKEATATIGAPLTANAIAGPLPRPTSTLPEASACCSLASPPKAVISTSIPYFLKRPSCTPTSTPMKVQAMPTALPTRTASLAQAGAASAASAAPIAKCRTAPGMAPPPR
jgi:hypothetical protein